MTSVGPSHAAAVSRELDAALARLGGASLTTRNNVVQDSQHASFTPGGPGSLGTSMLGSRMTSTQQLLAPQAVGITATHPSVAEDTLASIARSFQDPENPPPLPRLHGPGGERSMLSGYSLSSGSPWQPAQASAPNSGGFGLPQQQQQFPRQSSQPLLRPNVPPLAYQESFVQNGAAPAQGEAWWRHQEPITMPPEHTAAYLHASSGASRGLSPMSPRELSHVDAMLGGPAFQAPQVPQLSQAVHPAPATRDLLVAPQMPPQQQQAFLDNSQNISMLPSSVPWPPPPLPPVSSDLRVRLEKLEKQRDTQAIVDSSRDKKMEQLIAELLVAEKSGQHCVQLEAELQRLRQDRLAETDQLKNERMGRERSESECIRLQQEIRELAATFDTERRAREEAERRCSEARTERDKMILDVEGLQDAARSQLTGVKEVERLQSDVLASQADLQQERRRREESDRKYQEIREESIRDNESKDSLRLSFDRAKAQSSELERDMQRQKDSSQRQHDTLLRENESLRLEAQRLEDQVRNYDAKMSTQQTKVVSLQSQLDNAGLNRDEASRLREEVDTHKRSEQLRRETESDMRRALQGQEMDMQGLRDELHTTKSELSKLQAENRARVARERFQDAKTMLIRSPAAVNMVASAFSHSQPGSPGAGNNDMVSVDLNAIDELAS